MRPGLPISHQTAASAALKGRNPAKKKPIGPCQGAQAPISAQPNSLIRRSLCSYVKCSKRRVGFQPTVTIGPKVG